MTECGLSFDGLTVEVIADNKHISQLLFEFILKCKTYRRICLISDSLSCAGMPNGKYKLGEEDVVTDGKVCYLADMSALAGSVTSIDQWYATCCLMALNWDKQSIWRRNLHANM